MRIINFELYNKSISKKRIRIRHKCANRKRTKSHLDLLLIKNINRFNREITYLGNRTFRLHSKTDLRFFYTTINNGGLVFYRISVMLFIVCEWVRKLKPIANEKYEKKY